MNITVKIKKQGEIRRDYLQWIDAKALKNKRFKGKTKKKKSKLKS